MRILFRGADHLISSAKCQRNIGLLIICIGDLETEPTLLDPLSKSVTQFCRLLASDDYVRFYKIRSVAELTAIWARDHAAYSHIVLIAHGNGSSLRFADDGWQTAAQLEPVLAIPGVVPKYFVNLACQAGQAPLGKPFSRLAVCDSYVGAYQSVHGAIASQFLQSFLIHHLLQGETSKVGRKPKVDRDARRSDPDGYSEVAVSRLDSYPVACPAKGGQQSVQNPQPSQVEGVVELGE